MPHIECHYSAAAGKPSVMTVLREIHLAAASTGIVKAEDLKIRALAFDDYLVGGEARSFFHVTFYLLAGRASEEKERLAVVIRATLVGLLDAIDSVSVDIRDMDPVAYKKRLKIV